MLIMNYVHHSNATQCRKPISSQLPRHKRMSSTQPTTNRPSLSINIATLITTKEKRNTRNLISNSSPLQRVQLSDLALRTALPRPVKHRLRHPRLNKPRTDRVHADTRPSELVRDRLRDRYNCCL